MPRTKLFYNYFKEYDNWVIYIFHTFQSELNSVKKVIPDNRNGIEMGVGSYILSEEFKNQYIILSGNQPIKIKNLLNMISEMFQSAIKLL